MYINFVRKSLAQFGQGNRNVNAVANYFQFNAYNLGVSVTTQYPSVVWPNFKEESDFNLCQKVFASNTNKM